MTSEGKDLPHWAMQVLQVLEDEFDAQGRDDFDVPAALENAFEPIAFWVAYGLAPMTAAVAGLRGQDKLFMTGHDAYLDPTEDPTLLGALVLAQIQFSFEYDQYYDAMYESAVDFAHLNQEMISEHFGSAENYAEHYAETSSDAMGEMSVRTIGAALSARVASAFATRDVAVWASCYPAAYTRGMLRSYKNALGPHTTTDLATELKNKLHTAFGQTVPA